MELTSEIVVLAVAILVFNVLDSATTSLRFRLWPDKGLKAEGNPFMRRFMLKSKKWADIWKHGGVLLFVAVLVWQESMTLLRLLPISLGLVVLSNSYVIVGRLIRKKVIHAPFEKLRMVLRVPESYSFFSFLLLLLLVSSIIYWLIWS